LVGVSERTFKKNSKTKTNKRKDFFKKEKKRREEEKLLVDTLKTRMKKKVELDCVYKENTHFVYY